MRSIDDLRQIAQTFGAEALTIEERCALKGIEKWTALPPTYHEAAGRAVGTNIEGHIVQTADGPVALTKVGQLAMKKLAETDTDPEPPPTGPGIPYGNVVVETGAVVCPVCDVECENTPAYAEHFEAEHRPCWFLDGERIDIDKWIGEFGCRLTYHETETIDQMLPGMSFEMVSEAWAGQILEYREGGGE